MAFINIGQVVYPVGSIYISTDPTSPGNLFGGEWEIIADAYLRAIGSTGVTVGEYGGYQDYTLTIDQMPSHSHGIKYSWNAGKPGNYSNWRVVLQQAEIGSNGEVNPSDSSQFGISSNGGGQSFPMLPRYVSVYMWKRKL